MRESFSSHLVSLVERNSSVYVLSGDHGYALFDEIRKKHPLHFINAGVAEQNMVGVGAGLAKVGFYPIIYGLSAFVPIRVLEQIKVDFCYENLPGLFIGDGAGVVYSHLGASHQSTEDISALRGIPNVSILSPCDDFEFKACFNWAVSQKSPVYLRMGKADLGAVHKDDLGPLSMMPIQVLNVRSKNAIFATGSMVKVCAELIASGNINADLFSVPVIKGVAPSDWTQIMPNYDRIASVEEHSVHGGLGDVVASQAATNGSIKVKKIGIEDKFSNYCGTYQYLMKEHGLDSDGLAFKLRQWFGI